MNPDRATQAMEGNLNDVMLGSLELFCLAAELQSCTAAAQAAGLNPAAVSRSVARLEVRLVCDSLCAARGASS